MLVVVVDNEAKAYEASRALQELDFEGDISIYAEAVIQKNGDGTITTKASDTDFPIRTMTGTAVGAMVGVLGGPLGVGIGTMAGTLAGVFGDLYQAGVGAEFIDDVAATLKPGKFAVIADVSEEWVTPVDVRMEALGGTVFRSPKKSVEAEQRAREVARLRAEIHQTKAELAQAQGDRKAKLQARIDKLNAQLEAQLDQAKQRSQQIKSETEAEVQALQKKAEKAQGDVKATLDARVKQLRGQCKEAEKNLKHLVAGQMREAAARLEK
ncbi:MAG TPA: hypothetical protein DEP35_01550 [Deltaproteobacteria bacterium]|nr:hypothetical protein [Deltaproteobacteria bacterium]